MGEWSAAAVVFLGGVVHVSECATPTADRARPSELEAQLPGIKYPAVGSRGGVGVREFGRDDREGFSGFRIGTVSKTSLLCPER